MRRILSFLLLTVLLFNSALPCYAAEISEENDSITGDVYARYVKSMKQDDVPVEDEKAEIVTDNGYTVTITGAPNNAVALRVVPIPSAETAAWRWFVECIGSEKTILGIFDIYFEDANGKRINADGVKISISNVSGEITVFSVTTSGHAVELNCITANSSVTFTANGSHYYVLSKNENTAPDPDNNVTIEDPEGGDVEISDENPETGDMVTITPIPDEGKVVDKVIVKDENGNEVPVTDNGDGTYSYVQPDGDVTIKITFKDKEPAPAEEYNVTIKDTSGGDVEVSDMTPTAGQTVTIKPKPNNGKVIDKVSVTDENGKNVKVTDNGDGTYSYIQPEGDVLITVTFKNIPWGDRLENPATGDNYHIVLWALAAVLSAVVLSWLTQRKRKEKQL